MGILQAGMLDSPYSLTEVRVLFELAHAGRLETGELRALLDLDAGYLSRILGRFEAGGLISRERSAADARKQVVSLTEAGAATFDGLDARSSEQIERLLAGLPDERQRRLVACMATIRELLGGPAEREPYLIRPPRTGDLGWVVHRHGELYSAEWGWGMEFERLVARIVADYDPARDAGWIAEIGGERAGCVFCVHEDDTTARLRMLLVEPSARGLGLGRALVEECVRHARDRGYERITLWTRDCLAGARRIYEAAGFELESEERGTENGIEVGEQRWTLGLRRPA
ncbi:bifunctional helix-turn-helix transcriptional regulator/GNAT family N-acetyltransferase [Nonomuraea cavernae]|uniref:MarR family transcriptional regulator n=1 Tax=Nonomuraea cavernae TaxID=2045107 RepID=A0A918DS44_9ACTN|nr:helix-turn-helix domain-containing GNAT family N-acetyltransferase [Nonomuraea cavernae]MCA2190649.1 helix-turn-helix domain-containing GNAT family N-acetyltransferase [Nonomuraea cavernae]GGO81792.1 MarR family transcriptional regulator [Nonomuraea cavernae]